MGPMNRTFLVQKPTSDVYVYGRNVHIYKQMNECCELCSGLEITAE